MVRIARNLATALGLCALTFAATASEAPKATSAEWAMNATIIEACSCPMFCQCYFASKPAAHAAMASDKHDHASHDMAGAEHFCKFNNAFQISKGKYGSVKLDGAKFWVAGDLGDDFSDGEMNWAVPTFDPSVTPAQREGIGAILGHVYPVKWKSFAMASDAAMEWTATKDQATAKLAGGKIAEVVLQRSTQSNTDAPIVIHNLKYWGVPRNDGFVLMQNSVEAYRVGENPFEYKGTNGFMITIDINSKDMSPKKM
ncbi:MAG: DUF1326 domain-containing protein [Candidatus Eisenbacteria bacterium]